MTDAWSVEGVRETLLADLRRHLPAGDAWTAIDYPMHANCGDGAIFAGQEAAGRTLGARTGAVLDRKSYRAGLVEDGSVVVIQGGGNWGGLYRTHHALRVKVLQELQGRPTVQMPQSIEYVDEAHREQLRRAVSGHGALTLLVRDTRSLAIAERDYDCPVHLVPDLAFALGVLPRGRATQAVVTQQRTDKETPRETRDLTSFDWLDPSRLTKTRALLSLSVRANALQVRRTSAAAKAATRTLTSALAAENVARGSRLLSRGEAAVTDRLHGHVLCTLLRIPHVVVNDRYGKIRALYDTWTADDPLSVLADSWTDVPDLLDEVRSRS